MNKENTKKKAVNGNAVSDLLSKVKRPKDKESAAKPNINLTDETVGNGLGKNLKQSSNEPTIEKTYKSTDGHTVTKINSRKIVQVSETKLHSKNPRIRGKLDPVFLTSIQEGGVEKDIITVRYQGDSTLYVIDGGTRREGCLQSDISDIPAEIIDIKDGEEWIVDWIISTNNNRREFSTLENMVRVSGFLLECETISMRGLSALIQRRIQVSVSFSTLPTYICAGLIFDLSRNIPTFFKFDNTNKISAKIIAEVIKFVSGKEISQLMSEIPRGTIDVANSNQQTTGMDFKNITGFRTNDVIEMISMVNDEFQKSINETRVDKVDDVLRLKVLKKIVSKKKTVIDSEKTPIPSKPELIGQFLSGDKAELDFSINISRSDYDHEQLEKIKELFVQYNALELFSKIEKITEA